MIHDQCPLPGYFSQVWLKCGVINILIYSPAGGYVCCFEVESFVYYYIDIYLKYAIFELSWRARKKRKSKACKRYQLYSSDLQVFKWWRKQEYLAKPALNLKSLVTDSHAPSGIRTQAKMRDSEQSVDNPFNPYAAIG